MLSLNKKSLSSEEAQKGINMVDLMMWLVIAALLLAAALQGISYYQKAALLHQMKTGADGAGSQSMSLAAASGDLDLAAVEQGAANTDWSKDLTYLVQESTTGEPYIRVSHAEVTETDVIYLFESCTEEYAVGVNVIPKSGDVILESCGVTAPVAEEPAPTEPVAPAAARMVTTWDTSLTNCATVELPVRGTTNATIDWGDGTVETISGTKNWTNYPTHTYSDTTTPKTVTIDGTFAGWGDLTQYWTPTCITSVNEWGPTGTTDLSNGFYGASNLTEIADIPDGVTNMYFMLAAATKFNDDISNWDTSKVQNMTYLFYKTPFNQDISSWDTSSVTTMNYMFRDAKSFNQPIGNWNTSSVQVMSFVFYGASAFNQNINNWDTSNVTTMAGMFNGATVFNQPLDKWNISQVTGLNAMFWGARDFNQPIGNWNTSSVTNLNAMFREARAFNQPIDQWNTSNVTSMSMVFMSASAFNQPISNWNTSNVTTMHSMFWGASIFNQPIGNWDTSNVTSMFSLFATAMKFNQDISGWNTSKVTDMTQVFYHAREFNQPVNSWNTANVTSMTGMFGYAYAFNQPLSSWDTSKVTKMDSMFMNADLFNQDISGWSTLNVTTMENMFRYADLFNQNLSGWNVNNVTNYLNFASNAFLLENRPVWVH